MPWEDVPDFHERLLEAADAAGVTPVELQRGLTELGLSTSRTYTYKLWSGEVSNPSRRLIGGLSYLLGVDVRWWYLNDVQLADMIMATTPRGGAARHD